MKKILKRVGIGLLAAVVLLAAGLGWMFRKEIQTLNSIRKVDDYGMYQIEYSADYGLDQLVASGGASSDSELVSYVASKFCNLAMPCDISSRPKTTRAASNSHELRESMNGVNER